MLEREREIEILILFVHMLSDEEAVKKLGKWTMERVLLRTEHEKTSKDVEESKTEQRRMGVVTGEREVEEEVEA